MQTVPQTPPMGAYADGLRRTADTLDGGESAFGALLNRLVCVEHHDDVSSSILRVTESDAILAGAVSLKGGAEIVSDSVHVFRAIAAHATEVADRLEASRAPVGQHDDFCSHSPVTCGAVHS